MKVLEPTVFREEVVCTADDELVDQPAELLELGVTLLLLLVRRVGVTTTENLVFKVLLEVGLGAEILGVGKVEEGKVL